MKIVEKIKRNKLAFGGGGLAVLGVLSWLAFGYFGIHTAFIDDVVDEEGPVFTVTPEGSGETAAPAADDAATDADADADEESDAAVGDDAATEADDAVADEASDPTADGSSDEAGQDGEEPEQNADAAGEVVTIFDGDFTSLSRYSVNGDALVLNNGTEQRFLRFENFESSNGPDLKVYLRAENGDFVNLGELSGNIGNQNYPIPIGTALNDYASVVIWCELFGVLFSPATLVLVEPS